VPFRCFICFLALPSTFCTRLLLVVVPHVYRTTFVSTSRCVVLVVVVAHVHTPTWVVVVPRWVFTPVPTNLFVRALRHAVPSLCWCLRALRALRLRTRLRIPHTRVHCLPLLPATCVSQVRVCLLRSRRTLPHRRPFAYMFTLTYASRLHALCLPALHAHTVCDLCTTTRLPTATLPPAALPRRARIFSARTSPHVPRARTVRTRQSLTLLSSVQHCTFCHVGGVIVFIVGVTQPSTPLPYYTLFLIAQPHTLLHTTSDYIYYTSHPTFYFYYLGCPHCRIPL